MVITPRSIEWLPNELWLLFMSFLSSIDLYRALVGLNHRINGLVFAMSPRPILDTSQCDSSSIRLSDMRQLLEGKDDWSKYLLSSIDTIRLCGTLASDALCNNHHSLIQLSSINTSFSRLFPSLRRLYMTEGAIRRINIVEALLPLSTSLRYIHFTFGTPIRSSSYLKMLNTFTDHQLSFYSMVFDVEVDGISDDWYFDTYEWKTMHLPNTVHLSLFIGRLSDLFILLDTQLLPVLDHLCITFMKQTKHNILNDIQVTNVTNIVSRLRSLKLSYMSLDDLLTFLSLVHMPLVEKLTLIEIHDKTFNRLIDFQKYFQSKKNMPVLRPSCLRFLLRFPGELECQWHRHCNFEWPFEANNIDYCLEEQRLHCLTYYRSKLPSLPKKYSFLIFTRSPLPYHRIIHNHSIAMKLKQEPSTSSIQWTCDHIKSSEEIFNVLSKFKTTKKLSIGRWGGTNLQNAATRLIILSSHFNQFRLDKLRSLTFFVNHNFLLKSQQLPFLHLLLSAAPQLMDLTIGWNHVMSIDSVFASGLFAVSPLLNLRHLHLYVCNGYESISLPKLIDISILSKYFPRLVSLWTSRCGLHPDENLAELIISLVTYFEQLVEIIINKGSSYRRDGFHGLDKLLVQQKCVNNLLRNTPKLRDTNRTNIVWNNYTQLKIWL
ncbi:unnamed protein product [Rotaria magnacalcarata]|uniref:Uncharacterized protein n=1 Tax=Rotaria magnacalcarata TaxID=392030 RepID=A0A814JDC4_9BILA|nr:unnamed protein product [Rotaria magnacalcarata]